MITVRELEVTTRLKELSGNREAILFLPDRIRALEIKAQSIKAVQTDAEPVNGGGGTQEDARIQNIIQIDRAKDDLAYATMEVKQLEDALNKLSPTDRMILDKLYISNRGSVREAHLRLAGEMNYDDRTIYRKKNEALNRLALMLYGSRQH